MIRMSRLALALAALPLLGACASGPQGTSIGGIVVPGTAPAVPPEPVYPAEVIEALPPGVPSSVLMTDSAGCYIFSIERTLPPTGYYVRGSDGQPICQGGAQPTDPTPTFLDETPPGGIAA